MTIEQAAKSAMNCQNACNASGLIRTLSEITQVLWDQQKGTKWVNRHPIIALYLFKIGELNGYGVSSLMPGYEVAWEYCRSIAAGEPQGDYSGLVIPD